MSENPRNRTNLYRDHDALRGLDKSNYDAEEQIIRGVAVATETPVDFWWVKEIMDMDSLDLSIFNDSAPVLLSHNSREHIGVVVAGSAEVKDGVLRADIRFSKHNEQSRTIFAELVDGIRTRLSVGAKIDPENIIDEEDAEEETIRLLNCQPYEVSVVAMGADPKAGVDREGYNPNSPYDPKPATEPENTGPNMSETNPNEQTFDFQFATKTARENDMGLEVLEGWQNSKFSKTDILEDVVSRQRKAAEQKEAERIETEKQKAANDELERSKGRRRSTKQPETLEDVAKRASLRDALNYALGEGQPKGAYAEYVKEREGNMRHGGVPLAVVQMPLVHRAFTSAAGSGGSLVSPMVDPYVDPALRTASLLTKLGVNRRTLEAGKQSLPYVSGASSVTYQPRNNLTAINNTQPAITAVTVEPRTASCKVQVSRTLLKDSDVVDPLVVTEEDVLSAFEEKYTAVLFNGVATSNEPIGLDNRTGVGALTIGTAGQPTFGEMLTAYTTVVTALRDAGRVASFAFVITAAVWQHLRSTVQTAGDHTKIIAAGDGFANGYFEGYPIHILEALPTHGLYAGDFRGVEVVTWGDMEIRVDNLTPDGGGIDYRFFSDNDIGIRRTNAFVEGSRV